MTPDQTLQLSALAALVQWMDQQTADHIKELADDQAARAARLTTVRDRLLKTLGDANPRVAALTNSIQTSGQLAESLNTVALRMAQKPAPDPAEMSVSGRVLDSAGQPMQAVSVRLSNSEGTLAVGPRVQTNETGDFTLTVNADAVPSPVSQLFVVVEDAHGARVAISPEPVDLQAGSPVHLDLVQGTETSAPSRPQDSVEPPPPEVKGV